MIPEHRGCEHGLFGPCGHPGAIVIQTGRERFLADSTAGGQHVESPGELFARPPVGQPTAWFYPSVGHEEALARLLYLAEFGRAGGQMVGPRGVGKSFVLQEAARDLSASRRVVISLDLAGCDADDVIEQAMTAVDLPVSPRHSRHDTERHLRTFLQGQQLVGTPVVFLIDHLDDVSDQVLRAVDRLIRLADPSLGAVTVLMASRSLVTSNVVDRYCELRVDLNPFGREDVAGYLSAASERANGPGFDASAIDTIVTATGGVPRDIERVARLAALAASSEGLETITGELVSIAAGEVLIGA